MASRNKKRVRLREQKGDAVPYTTDDNLAPYLRALFAQLPLDTHLFERLDDFAAHRAGLARALVAVTAHDASETVLRALQEVPGARAQLLNYVLQCYFVAHRRAALLTGDGVVEAARHMWALLMHAYLDAARRESKAAQDATQRVLATKMSALRFCAIAQARGEPIAVSADPVQLLSVRTHWQALSSAATALYTFPYSTDMYTFLRALTVRHAQLLAGEVEDASDAEALAAAYDHPKYCAPDVGRPYLRAGPQNAVVLNDLYLGDTETLLGAQLVRLNRVRWLIETATRAPHGGAAARLDTAPTPRAWADAVRAFTDDLAVHEKLRRFVVDKVQEGIVGTLLMHGETARFARAHPRQDPVPDNVLATMRHNAYKTVAVLKAKPVAEFMREALAAIAEAEAGDGGDWSARARHESEAPALLLLAIATDNWLQYMGAGPAFVPSRLHLEEMHVGKDELAPVFEVPAARPCLVRCMRWHFVITEKNAFAYAGTGLVAAYAAWLRALFDACPDNGRGAKLTRAALHDAWRPLLAPPVPASAPAVVAEPGAQAAFFA